RVLFVDRHTSCGTQVFKLDVLEFDPEVFTDDLATRKDRNVFQHRLTTITEARRLDRCDVDRATQSVDHEGCEGLAFYILRDNQDWLAQLSDLLKNGKHVSHRRNLLFAEQNDWILEHRFHRFRVSNEVGRKIAAIELHSFDNFQSRLHCFRFFDGDY